MAKGKKKIHVRDRAGVSRVRLPSEVVEKLLVVEAPAPARIRITLDELEGRSSEVCEAIHQFIVAGLNAQRAVDASTAPPPKPRHRNGPRWNLINRTVILLCDLIGNDDELFTRGTRMRVGSEPMGQLAGKDFMLMAKEGPENLPSGLWRGIRAVPREQFETVPESKSAGERR